MSIRQVSVFLENKPGKLSEMTALLAEKNIDIRALSLAETNDFGIARMIVDDAYYAINELRNADFIANISHVLAFAVPDEPGGLNKLLNGYIRYYMSVMVNIRYRSRYFRKDHLRLVAFRDIIYDLCCLRARERSRR